MRLIDYILIAFRNISRQKLRSALTVFAIVIGATSVTIMLALVTGAKGFFTAQFEASGALQQVIVTRATDLEFDEARWGGNSNDGVKLTDNIVNKIKQIPHVSGVARTYSPYVFEHMEFEGKKYTVQNISSNDANGVITHNVLAGRDFTTSDGKGLITVSKEYADKFGYAKKYDQLVGKKVTLVTTSFYTGEGAEIVNPADCNGPEDPKCKNMNQKDKPGIPMEATIVGVLENDGPGLMVPFSWTRQLAVNRHYEETDADRKANEAARRTMRPGQTQPKSQATLITEDMIAESGYQTLVVKAETTSDVEAVATEIRKLGIGAATAKQFMDQQIKIFNILGYILGGIGAIALLVAAIGVVNTMIMAILERTREIGVMRAVGAKRATVSSLFTFEAALLGFWGGVFGVAVGYGLTRVANIFINQQLASNSVRANNIIGVPIWLVLTVIGATSLIGMLAGLYPARRAAKLDPVEALRYE